MAGLFSRFFAAEDESREQDDKQQEDAHKGERKNLTSQHILFNIPFETTNLAENELRYWHQTNERRNEVNRSHT